MLTCLIEVDWFSTPKLLILAALLTSFDAHYMWFMLAIPYTDVDVANPYIYIAIDLPIISQLSLLGIGSISFERYLPLKVVPS